MIDGSFNNVTDVKLIKTGQADFILPFSLNSITTCGSQITATLDLQNKAVGYWDLVITTIDTTMIMQNAFMIDYPHINSISPNSGYNNGHAWANIYGYFYNVIHVKLTKTGQPDILSPDSLNNVTYYGSEIYADFNLLNKALGYWDLVVTTIDTTMILPNAFLIDTTNVIPISCFAHFTLIADTLVPHHYFGINNSYGISPINYLWNWGDSSTSTGPYPSHTYSVAGWYYICVTINDSTGCQSTYCDSSFLQKSTNTIVSIDVIPDVTIGISDYSTDNTFNIYPNPSPGLINIAFTGSTKETRVEILNSIGQVILTKEINNAITSLDLTNRAKGMYFIKVQSGNGVVLRKVIVE
jgi:hypothetical protein